MYTEADGCVTKAECRERRNLRETNMLNPLWIIFLFFYRFRSMTLFFQRWYAIDASRLRSQISSLYPNRLDRFTKLGWRELERSLAEYEVSRCVWIVGGKEYLPKSDELVTSNLVTLREKKT